ncbi:UDP-N-acetylglucosamine transferase subunit [Rhinocladiella similis]
MLSSKTDTHGAQMLGPSSWTNNPLSSAISLSTTSQILITVFATTVILLNIIFFRLVSILSRPAPSSRPQASSSNPTHILIVLGSGGHTAEMLNILSQAPCLQLDFTYRTYVVSSGDGFSALKAHEFEKSLLADLSSTPGITVPDHTSTNYDIVTVHRARRVHQGLLTAPWTSLRCLLDCIDVLKGTHRDLKSSQNKQRGYPDLILTNGPGTGVIVVLASIILLFFRCSGPRHGHQGSQPASFTHSGQMRTIFIESFARVKTLSLSGRLLKPLVHRFIVQWPDLVKSQGSKVEYIGPLVT